MDSDRQIVPGISVSPSGQATIAPSIKDVLFDLAIALEEPKNLPVDIEHVVAALVLAVRNNEIEVNKDLSANDQKLIGVLAVHVKSVFALYGVDRLAVFPGHKHAQLRKMKQRNFNIR